jgi:dephospho-CoA kinase
MSLPFILHIVGLPGAGKSTAGAIVQADGVGVIETGTLMRERFECERRPDESYYDFVDRCILADPGGLNIQALRDAISRSFLTHHLVVVIGCRQSLQVRALGSTLASRVLWIDAPTAIRTERCRRRARSSDLTEDTFNERQHREAAWGSLAVYELADAIVMNDSTLAIFASRVSSAVRELGI